MILNEKYIYILCIQSELKGFANNYDIRDNMNNIKSLLET